MKSPKLMFEGTEAGVLADTPENEILEVPPPKPVDVNAVADPEVV